MAGKKHKSFKQVFGRSPIGFIAIFAVFLAFLLLNPNGNLLQWIAAKREIAVQTRQARRYQMEIMQMEERIDALTQDRDSLEKFARERFHFTAPGETVYLGTDE